MKSQVQCTTLQQSSGTLETSIEGSSATVPATIQDPTNAAECLGLSSSPAVARPESGDELAAVLAECSAARRRVVPWGGGTHQDIGAPPSACDVLLCTAGLNGILAYAPEDLTVSAHAGTPLQVVNDILGQHGQFLPLDAMMPEVATVGGSVAIGAGSIHRARFGAARDIVIGMTVALADGSLTKSGGRVVKNVAGYDLCKLFTGSLGTLGVIVSVNFKVFPIPRRVAFIRRTFRDDYVACKAAASVAKLNSYFTFVQCDGSTSNHDVHVSAFVEGHAGELHTEIDHARAALRDGDGVFEVLRGDNAQESAYESAVPPPETSPDAIRLVCSVPPARVYTALRQVRAVLVQHAVCGAWRAELISGSLIFWIEASHDSGLIATMVSHARHEIREVGGNLKVGGGTAALRREIDVWGALESAAKLSRAVKLKMDPYGLLNPGRFVYGI